MTESIQRVQIEKPTHAELVARAVKWLLGAGRCSIAFSEFSTMAWEKPDALGFSAWASTMIECKVSRSDFAADKKKPFRRNPYLGLGLQRYFMVPAGLVMVEEIPPKWGLLYVTGRHVKVIRKSEGFAARALGTEIGFLVSMLRRAEIRAINAHYAAGRKTRPSDFLNQWLREENAGGVLVEEAGAALPGAGLDSQAAGGTLPTPGRDGGLKTAGMEGK